MINQQQALDVAAKIVAIAGGYAAGKGWIQSDQIALIGGVVAAVIPLVWSLYANRQAAQVKNVAAMPGVEKILTNDKASATLEAMAQDDHQPKVEPAK